MQGNGVEVDTQIRFHLENDQFLWLVPFWSNQKSEKQMAGIQNLDGAVALLSF